MKYTKQQIINCLKEKANELGRTPCIAELGIHHSIICYYFNNMKTLLKKAKLAPFKQLRKQIRIEKCCPICFNKFTTTPYLDKSFCCITCSNISRRTSNWKPSTGLNREEWIKALREKWKEVPFENLSWGARRKRVIQEQNEKCNKCGNNTWQGEPLTLEVDHINGNRDDHCRENLEGLCPNCHSLTSTWKGRNLRKKNSLTDEELKTILQNAPNIRQGLIAAGMSPRGRNYERAYRLLRNANFDGEVLPLK